jgi:hypothetical protein
MSRVFIHAIFVRVSYINYTQEVYASHGFTKYGSVFVCLINSRISELEVRNMFLGLCVK